MIIHMSFSIPHRLRTDDGGYVYMTWHRYCGPEFYQDRECNREIVEWWAVPALDRALSWFIGRGERA
jgi:hypothetical protein